MQYGYSYELGCGSFLSWYYNQDDCLPVAVPQSLVADLQSIGAVPRHLVVPPVVC